ncbi:GGDEF domain-containing protein [Paenibacillus rhizovicinus]|uniref:GGDEF domain-containing protein n=1 Tax=Paenibacillus rhizovicinus TaxID=2704463 RepID=A0A6C0NX72_9BACL|nr:GGDEF domain-containing protein [Paenibacillus rhizovicinus]QHW30820.1 GGDEF domain-containing protein [Paenibacillus rhizovicinus]
MSNHGRWIAAAVSLGMTAVSAGLCYLSSSQGHMLVSVQLGLAVLAAAALPTAWMFGRSYDRLRLEATIDSLTGAYNRRFIDTTFKKLLRQASRKRKRMTVIMLDVNDFKEVNDRLGHQQGDMALKLIAETLQSCSDRGEFVGRWGGDEFIMICPYSDDKAIDRVIKRIQEQLLVVSRRVGLRLSVAVGHAVFPEQGKDLSQLMNTADKKMYGDKYVCKSQETEPAALQA